MEIPTILIKEYSPPIARNRLEVSSSDCIGKLIVFAIGLRQEAYVLHLLSVTYFRQRRGLKVISLLLLIFGIGLVIAHGTFENEFLRITCLVTTLAFTYYAYLHWFIRILAMLFNILTVLILEVCYFRELLLQLACYDIGKSALS